MEYKNGYVLLEKQEIDFLSFMLMNAIDAKYDAQEFIGSLRESQASLLEERQRYASLNDRGAREDAAVSLIEVMVELCERFIGMAKKAATEAGASIEFH